MQQMHFNSMRCINLPDYWTRKIAVIEERERSVFNELQLTKKNTFVVERIRRNSIVIDVIH